jgi:hypothetical protein
MSSMTPQLLRRVALTSLVVGLALLVIIEVVFFATARHTVTNDSIFLVFIGVFVEWLGCVAVVFAVNALAWSFIVPRLPEPSPKRGIIVSFTTLVFGLLSVTAVFFLLLYLPEG